MGAVFAHIPPHPRFREAEQAMAAGCVCAQGVTGSLGSWGVHAPLAALGGELTGLCGAEGLQQSWEEWGWHWKLDGDGSRADEAVPSPSKAPGPWGALVETLGVK